MRLGLALRAFWKAMFDRQVAERVALALDGVDLTADSSAQSTPAACLKQCRQTLDRLLAIKPLADAENGGLIPVEANASSARLRWVGEASGASQGKVVHSGWVATQVQLPAWSGGSEDALVIAPTQVEAP